PRAPYARRFARELRKAMDRRQVGRIRLARAMGLRSHSIVAQWLTANTLPRLDSATLLAEVLEWDRLVEIVREARTQLCARASCEVVFVNEGGGPKMFCSERCRRIQESVDGVRSGRRDRDTLFRERGPPRRSTAPGAGPVCPRSCARWWPPGSGTVRSTPSRRAGTRTSRPANGGTPDALPDLPGWKSPTTRVRSRRSSGTASPSTRSIRR
ncbi:MAG: hypothetical protein ACRDL8_23380, partial [Solirubrobacteraceae bacterium]